MNKKEVYTLIEEVVEYYPNFIDFSDDDKVQRRMDAWHRALKDCDSESILDNLAEYAKTNDFPPKISDLLKGVSLNRPYNIPDVAETKEIVKKYAPAPESERLTTEQAKQLVRERLGWKI